MIDAENWSRATLSSARPNTPFTPTRSCRAASSHVVDNAVDAADFVDDAGGGAAEETHIVVVEIRGHAVDRGDGAQGADEFVGAAIAHDADGLDRQQHGKGLPDGVVEAGLADLVEIDGIGFAQDFELFAGDAARAADGEARTREGVAADETVGQAEFLAEHAHFILEQLAQRLDQLHVHALGQAADIVVRLDGDRRAAGEGNAFDHVGIERALREEIGAAELLGFLLKDLDEQPADGLALVFRVASPSSALMKRSCASTRIKCRL